ncbi:CLUMA_CG008933, isoform A [Clunio marinus]|uniref:RING-type E3 ubiquitin transferase n=1 Tax=Clunio marinus TaxID=568069 RepID=A0A1J1I5A6_9DIPT|nr:CLUMA_CG008933, isoform A [Clunio marinus]
MTGEGDKVKQLYCVKYSDSATLQTRYICVQKPTRMPVQAPSWTEFLICPICTNEFAVNLRSPITLRCGHSICKKCLSNIQQCPYDQSSITKDLDNLPINYALLQLVSSPNEIIEPEIPTAIKLSLTEDDLKSYKKSKSCIEELALYLKPNGSISGLFSRPMQRKLVTLINCQLVEDEGRARAMRAARSLGERTVTELILQHQNPQQLSANLWAAVRARGCQFLGPAMQEEVLKLVLLALEDGVSLCRKVLVMFVVQRLESAFPQASKTSIGHVVQLLYRASCFKVSKRDGDSSLMQLKEEFRTYKNLRKEHDAQIVQIATEAGLRIAPDQWSALLYGDANHKSDMQSLIDKQQSPQSFGQSVQELMIALQRTEDPAKLSLLRDDLKSLAAIDASSESNLTPKWNECEDAIVAGKNVVDGLVKYIQHHGNRKPQDVSHLSHSTRYKISFCRDLSIRGNCPRGQNCTFAHSDEELERYRAKMKKNVMRQQMKDMPPSSTYPVNNNNGPNPKVNISHPPYGSASSGAGGSYNKSMPYRSENSLHNNHTPSKIASQHLMPTTYPTSGSSSNSTPNLSQSQLSPKLLSGVGANNNNRFSYNAHNYNNYSPHYANSSPPLPNFVQKIGYQNYRPTPLSAPPTSSQHYMKTSPSGFSPDYNKQYSPYRNQIPTAMKSTTGNHNNNGGSGFYQMPPPMLRNEDFSNNNNSNGNLGDVGKYNLSWRSGNGKVDKLKTPIRSPNNLAPRSPTSQTNSNNASPSGLIELSPIEINRMMYRNNNKTVDEVDSLAMSDIYGPGKQQSAFQFDTSQLAKNNFTRSDSILASCTDDDFTFENNSTSGQYGAIGIKTSPPTSTSSRIWNSGMMQKRMESTYNNGNDSKIGLYNMSRMNLTSNGSGNNSASRGNFLNMHMNPCELNVQVSTPRTTADDQQQNSIWSKPIQSWSDGDFDLSHDLNSGMSKNLWDFIDE